MKLFLLNRRRLIMIKSLTALAVLVLLPTLAFAQHSHTGRVTRSFTEPIQRSVVASTESGVIRDAHVREGDRVKAGDELAALNRGVLLEEMRLACLLYTSPSPRDATLSRMPSSA